MKFPECSTAMIIAHPGHELLVLSALRHTQPLTAIFTDGSGSINEPRISYSERILEMAGAVRSSVFGRYSDKDCYAFIKARDSTPFVELRDELVEEFLADNVQQIFSDACEYYNPMHDLASYVADAVTIKLASKRGSPADRFVIPIAPSDGLTRVALKSDAVVSLPQTPDDLIFKLEAIGAYEPLAQEIQSAKTLEGEAYLQEKLCLHQPIAQAPGALEIEPFYERFGRERIAAGVYSELITYSEHMMQIANDILTAD
ncbi:MAG: hypothetical protein NXH70_07280 [Hyphomonas sp.]|nr:hypothetical protein [Hyphomonas sp.]